MTRPKNPSDKFPQALCGKAILFSFCFILYSLQAQEYNVSKYGPYSQIRFSAMPALYNNLDYENVGPQLYKSSVGVGGEVVVSYGQSIWKGFGVNGGIGIGFVPYNFSFDLVTDTSSSIAGDPGVLGQIPNRHAEFLLTIPMLIEKKFLLSPIEKLFLNIEAGIKWNLKFNSFTTSGGSYWARAESGEDVEYFEYRFTNITESDIISYVLKAGLFKVNRRGNSFSWNMVLQRSPATILRGTYQFNELGFESFGTNNLYNNYIGLEFIYGLSLGEKRNR